jgi:hypothetical protein
MLVALVLCRNLPHERQINKPLSSNRHVQIVAHMGGSRRTKATRIKQHSLSQCYYSALWSLLFNTTTLEMEAVDSPNIAELEY